MTRLWRFLWQRVLNCLMFQRAEIISAGSAVPHGTLYRKRVELALRWCDLKIDIVSALLGEKVQ